MASIGRNIRLAIRTKHHLFNVFYLAGFLARGIPVVIAQLLLAVQPLESVPDGKHNADGEQNLGKAQ